MQTSTSILLLFLLSCLARSLPTTDDHDRRSRHFRLRSQVLAPANPAFENLYLEPYHIYPAFNYATLYPRTDRSP
ncbi:MAG: hypothetical protein Q9196_006428, partial [Gyalolechia fulgens]